MNKIALLAALLATPLFAQAAPNLIVNGSFEDIGVTTGQTFGYSGSLASGQWDTFASLPGWTLASGPGIEVRHDVAGGTPYRNYFVELDADPAPGDTNIFQSVATTAGASYALSFAYSPRAGLDASTNGINVFWNGVALSGVITASNATSGNLWTTYTYSVTGTGLDKLSFASVLDADTLGGNIDNVSLTAAVPEPESYAMMLAGLGLMGFVARRRKNAA